MGVGVRVPASPSAVSPEAALEAGRRRRDWRVRLLSGLAHLLGERFKIDGLPYGAIKSGKGSQVGSVTFSTD